MIISCPSCQASFRVDAARLGPDGKKVRCSKCGNIWHALPDKARESTLVAMEETASASPAVAPAVGAAQQPSEERQGLPFSARDVGDGGPGSEALEQEPQEDGESEADDGLTGEQRAKLAAARSRKQPRGIGFWIKILAIFVVVVGLLLVAQKMGMVPTPGPKKTGSAVEQPANDVAPVDAKPAQGDTEPGQQGGHIVGGPLPENADQPGQ
jgi:predicted Zn finger-like uncharacterized protein